MSFVFQDVTLFNDTVFNNIRVGNMNATEEQVMAAAKAAYCNEFIQRLPDGYQTILGENGSTLSGGERQRISIARALLKDAPIILLDEATASLDPENEVLIQQAIAKLVEGKTVIMIAHRLRTVVDADQILVLDNGRLVEHGTHDCLLYTSFSAPFRTPETLDFTGVSGVFTVGTRLRKFFPSKQIFRKSVSILLAFCERKPC